MAKTFIADKETQDKIYSILSADEIYGFIEHCNVLSTTERIEYIGANKDYTPISLNKTTGAMTLNSWADFPIIKANKPWMVRSDGTPDYRLSETDYTKKEDGTTESDVSNTSYDGGAFAWLKKIYKQEYMEGDDRVVKFSMRPRDGFEPIGFVDPDGNELEGIWIPMFYGAIMGSDTETPKMVSLSGTQPEHDHITDVQHTAIANVGSRAAFFGGAAIETITDLLIMFAKNTNTQAAYGDGNCNGYDASAETHGVKQNAVVGGGQFYGTGDGKSLNKILHSIVLGSWNIWIRDPYTMLFNGRYKVSKNYKYDLTGAKLQDTGINLTRITNSGGDQNNGVFYPHRYQTIPGFGALPVHPCKGSTSTGGSDGLWQNCDITAVALRFGDCGSGADCGARFLFVGQPASTASWRIGSALLLLPPVGVAA